MSSGPCRVLLLKMQEAIRGYGTKNDLAGSLYTVMGDNGIFWSVDGSGGAGLYSSSRDLVFGMLVCE